MKEHQRRFTNDKKSAPKLRSMLAIKDVSFLRPEQRKAVLDLYQAGSRRELRAIFDRAIETYKSIAQGADPKAKGAMIRLLGLARDKNLHRVRVGYRGRTAKPSKALSRRLGRVVAMGPSFTLRLNRSRERQITAVLAKAFKKIVPEKVLEFPQARRARYGARAQTPEARPQLVFEIGYTVFPSGKVYVSRKNPSKRYAGVGFDWSLRITSGDEQIYLATERSFPPTHFSVYSSHRYASASDGTVYSSMANRAFDDFSKRLVRRFGIPDGGDKRTLGHRFDRSAAASRSL
ncbi:MAG: hypothetical protein JRH20_21545 [Deltaproteobacteria bacterium]|nr:hypothetical protein [Deltaproteobacteria bacterium]